MKYVGQTSRDVDTRFSEHCTETRGHSKLHNAIQKEGWLNFKVETIEEVPLDKLDEREKFWIKELNTQKDGYNILEGGQIKQEYDQLLVIENGLVFDSLEEASRIFGEVTSWSSLYVRDRIRESCNNNSDWLGYHFKREKRDNTSDVDTLIDWIKTLNIRFQGQHLYCFELQKEFETLGQAAKFLIDDNFYVNEKSKAPLQSCIALLSESLKRGEGKAEISFDLEKKLTFEKVPGTTKNKGAESPFLKNKIFCPQLNMTFDSQQEAASYLVKQEIWKGIKIKTAKLRISDIIRGVFSDYRGFTFVKCE